MLPGLSTPGGSSSLSTSTPMIVIFSWTVSDESQSHGHLPNPQALAFPTRLVVASAMAHTAETKTYCSLDPSEPTFGVSCLAHAATRRCLKATRQKTGNACITVDTERQGIQAHARTECAELVPNTLLVTSVATSVLQRQPYRETRPLSPSDGS